ncbi:MAG: glycerol-3-phosphate 1-O-acyltransferase PlsY [Candidatus Margulisbacteria bacterium]|nr:glycerol-3-phosphate 1-O-acyltransferase PlsY [Candidatus Margulisiibacteriota bacterium]
MPVIFVGLAYLLGSIPFGLLIAKIWNIDIRQQGSGNIGATNVLRTLGPGPGAVVFILDFLKGFLAVYLGYWIGGDPLMVLLLGTAAVLGHMYSVFLRFNGGKGAATGLGVLAGIAPGVFLLSVALAACLIGVTRYVSVGSIITPFAAALLMYLYHKPLPYVWVTLIIAVFILIRHLPNIKRLLTGTEKKLGEKG